MSQSTATHTVFSTMTSDVDFTFFQPQQSEGQAQTIDYVIRINGKANLANKVLITPRGATTAINEAEAEMLANHPVFARMRSNGFLVIERRGVELSDVVGDMVPRDESSPLEPVDFADLEINPMKLVSQQQEEADAAEPKPATIKAGATKRRTRANTSKASLDKTAK